MSQHQEARSAAAPRSLATARAPGLQTTVTIAGAGALAPAAVGPGTPVGAQAAVALGGGRTARGGWRQTLCWALWGALGGGALGRGLALLLVLLAGHLGGSSVSLDTFKKKVRAQAKGQ